MLTALSCHTTPLSYTTDLLWWCRTFFSFRHKALPSRHGPDTIEIDLPAEGWLIDGASSCRTLTTCSSPSMQHLFAGIFKYFCPSLFARKTGISLEVCLFASKPIYPIRIRETKHLSTDADSSTDHEVINNFHFLYPYLRVIIFFQTLKCHIS